MCDLKKNKMEYNIKKITLKHGYSYGKQLKPIRINKKLKLREMAQKMDCHLTNISHFESGRPSHRGNIETVFKYCKALGVKTVEFEL